MESKFNRPTELRPEGGRIIDGPLVKIDLKKFIHQIKDEVTWKSGDRNAITVYKTWGMRIVLIALHKDAVMVEHVADGVISAQVIEGKIIFTSNRETLELEAGDILTLHKGTPHSVTALEKSVFLLTVGLHCE